MQSAPQALSTRTQRIVGFDLARALAILGMFIVNFNTVFGAHADTSALGRFLTLFNGNSSTLFVMLAGMGVALMSNRPPYTPDEQQRLRGVVLRRSWFLFFIGLGLYVWWPADILHFYGAYMHVAALLLFMPTRTYLWGAAAAILIFHSLLLIIPYETGWNFNTLTYLDFWTVSGFLRNSLYNGWNPVFPWLAFFLLGMWLGRLDWQQRTLRFQLAGISLVVYGLVQVVQYWAEQPDHSGRIDPDLAFYLTADYVPPFLPFMLGTAGFGVIVLVGCLYVAERLQHASWLMPLVQTGKMTLTHYIVHLTLGMVLLAELTGRSYEAKLNTADALAPGWIMAYALLWFAGSVWFSHRWSRSHANGPFEALMRRLTRT